MIAAINALKAAEIQLDILTGKIKEMISAATDRANSLTDQGTAAYLAELDRSRGSWSSED